MTAPLVGEHITDQGQGDRHHPAGAERGQQPERDKHAGAIGQGGQRGEHDEPAADPRITRFRPIRSESGPHNKVIAP
ncbi:hypothetical protein MAUB_63650 (plasmid) [Mycolicibacterium aubagnense]|uniref:Uncharacterized protein n=1 Tax=Mycolicibacterium aubagnense TaxID=319707 RepID=A0ABM7IMZ6_9MYCO|nr:hypothetical protein MAUB_63650 [Mycolicibacterium aubagnense]